MRKKAKSLENPSHSLAKALVAWMDVRSLFLVDCDEPDERFTEIEEDLDAKYGRENFTPLYRLCFDIDDETHLTVLSEFEKLLDIPVEGIDLESRVARWAQLATSLENMMHNGAQA